MVHRVDYVEAKLAYLSDPQMGQAARPQIKAPGIVARTRIGQALRATLHPLDQRNTDANRALSMVIVDQGLAIAGE